MAKELKKKETLKDFLTRHCEVKSAAVSGVTKNKYYIFNAKDCVLFMAEAYIHGMRNAIGQNEEVMAIAKKSGDFSKLIMVYNWAAPAPGIDVVQIPESLITSLTKEQTAIFLRNLQRIQKDIDAGKARRTELQKLFGNKAIVETTYALDGERQFFIRGTVSSEDKRGYTERYVEHIATNVLFDLPKALNARLQALVPDEYDARHFIEERNSFSKKIRYGAEAHTELLLTDEGAALFTELSKKSPQAKTEISKLFQQAITDPFGLSLKYYMGKHPLIKLSSEEKE